MILNIAYLLFFVAADLVVYSRLNKTAWVNEKQFRLFCIGAALFALLHVFNLSFLMPGKLFSMLVFVFLFPIISYFWFSYFAIKKIRRIITPQNEGFVTTAIKVFSFFFLKLVYVMTLIMQISFIFDPSMMR